MEEKIKVTSLEIIVTGTKDKPYFEIKYKEVGKEYYCIGYGSYDLNNVLVWKEECFEIINQVEQEYNNGWIPCSSGILPEEHGSIFAKWKDTDKWKSTMFEKISNEVYVTIADESGDKIVTHAHTVDGKWSCELLKIHKMYKVIAWQPLPEPYEEGEYCFNGDCRFNTSNGKCIAWDGCGGCE